MTSHFTPYLTGKKNEFIVAENPFFMAILEEKPLVLGHCVVIPKREEDAFMDLSDHELSEILVFAKSVARAIQKAAPCQKIGIASLGLQVRHAHLHLVPINSADDLNFTRAKIVVSHQDLTNMAALIKTFI